MSIPHETPGALLGRLEQDGLLRRLATMEEAGPAKVGREGKFLWNFASNDYLGLSRHPRVIEAMIRAVRESGAGATASRLVCGSQPAHALLENALADAKGTEAALAFSSGYATTLGCIPVIVGKGDTVILDKLSHACLIDAARLSGATLRIVPHNDTGRLMDLLEKIRRRDAHARILVATESVFSMDGDVCPLHEWVEACELHDAMLWLDEAHAIGVLGPEGLGLARALGLESRVHFQMGTLGKALGVAGGYVAASREWIDLFINRARAFIYSTAPPAALAGAAQEALAISRSAEGDALREILRSHLSTLDLPHHPSAIIPIILGASDAALRASAKLEREGFLVPAIRFPTVPRGTARLRVSLSAAHPQESVQQLSIALASHRSGAL